MSLYRGFITVGGLTALSRVFGFLRDMLLAAVMGAGWVADAFIVSFRFPNLFRSLFAEGAFNSAFVPMFTKRLRAEGEESARGFAEEALAVLLVGVIAVTIVAEIFMPTLVRGLAIGFTGEKFELAVLLTRITFPYLACMAFVALTAGILNALGKFSAPAATPILLNLVLIVVTLCAAAAGFYAQPEAGIVQAWGVTIAGFAQLFYVAHAARRIGMDLGFRWPRLTPSTRRPARFGRSWRYHWRHQSGKPLHRHDDRLDAGQRGFVPLLRGPHQSAAARHGGHRHRRCAAAHANAPSG